MRFILLSLMLVVFGCAARNTISGGSTSDAQSNLVTHRRVTTGPAQTIDIRVDQEGSLSVTVARSASTTQETSHDKTTSEKSLTKPSASGNDVPSITQKDDDTFAIGFKASEVAARAKIVGGFVLVLCVVGGILIAIGKRIEGAGVIVLAFVLVMLPPWVYWVAVVIAVLLLAYRFRERFVQTVQAIEYGKDKTVRDGSAQTEATIDKVMDHAAEKTDKWVQSAIKSATNT